MEISMYTTILVALITAVIGPSALEIIKNHSEFLIELNNRNLCKYGGNSSIVSTFKFNPLNTNNYDKNNYELVFKDDGGIDEVSNLLSLVIKHKTKKN